MSSQALEPTPNLTRPCVMQIVGRFEGGGAQRQACNLVEALYEHGLESWGVSLRLQGHFAECSRYCERFLELGMRDQSLPDLLRGARLLRRSIQDRGVNVLHVHGSTGLPFIMFAIAGMPQRPKVVFVWQDSGIVADGRVPDRLTRWAIRRCDVLLASSRKVADWLRRVSGRSEVEVFQGGVPERPKSTPAARPQLIWVGRWVGGKDPATVIRCAAILKSWGYQFRIVMVGAADGRGLAFRRQHRELVDRLGLSECVEIPDTVSDIDLGHLVDSSLIGVQSSLSEGLSMALLEQMMAGLAIVATDVGDTRVALEDGRCGLLVQPGNENQFADAIGKLLTEPALCRQLSTLARARGIRCYSLRAMAANAIGVYQAAIATTSS